MANATLGNGATVKIKVSSAYTKIGGIVSFDGLLGGAAAIVDVSDLDSTRKEKLAGLPDEGQFSFEANYLSADAGQSALIANRASRTLSSFEVVLSGKKFAFDGFVLEANVGSGVDEKSKLSAKIEITGEVILSTPV